jgi:hypothetical protein
LLTETWHCIYGAGQGAKRLVAVGKRLWATAEETLFIAANYNHFEMMESLGNPYGPNGRAALALMKLAPACSEPRDWPDHDNWGRPPAACL